jgi:hypothetical protein
LGHDPQKEEHSEREDLERLQPQIAFFDLPESFPKFKQSPCIRNILGRFSMRRT